VPRFTTAPASSGPATTKKLAAKHLSNPDQREEDKYIKKKNCHSQYKISPTTQASTDYPAVHNL